MLNPFEVIETKLERIESLIQSLHPEQPEPNQAKYLTRQQAADRLHITLPTLHDYTRKGIIQGLRIQGRVLYSEQAIQESLTAIPNMKYFRAR